MPFNFNAMDIEQKLFTLAISNLPHQLPKTTGHRRSSSLSHIPLSYFNKHTETQSQWHSFDKSDLPTSQPAIS